MGIDHRIRPGQDIFLLPVHFHIRHFMMVRHNDRQSILLPVGDLLRCGDPVIAGNDRIDPVVDRTVDKINIQPVSILDPVRDVRIHVRPQSGQPLLQDVGGVYPVNIIVADHPDRLLFPDLFRENLHRPVHVLHQHSIVKIGDRAVQVEIDRLIPRDVPVADEPRKNRGNVILLRDRIEIRLLHRDEPSFHICCASRI